VKFGKPETRRVLKARRRRASDAARQACVALVWARAASLCEWCSARVVLPAHASWFGRAGHVHELRSRAQGGDPTDPANCALLCNSCHFSGPSGAHVGRPASMD
jgi:hypothetical protein